jgi:SSS family solute:Na+ symporter
MGAVRFILELGSSSHAFQLNSEFLKWLVGMNFLHYAVLMFVICSLALIGVSLATPPPERRQLAGLTFATVDDKLDTIVVAPDTRKPAHETTVEHRLNIVFSSLLVATVIGLWIYFR